MKKIKTLQILVYIVFGLFIIQNFAPDAYRGFIDGSNDASISANEHSTFSGPAVSAVLKANLIPGVTNDSLYVGKDYLLRNIYILADIRLNSSGLETPEWIKTITILSTMLIVTLLGYTASFINKIIVAIYEGSMFDSTTIRLIRKTGIYVIAYAITDYIHQLGDFLKQSAVIHAPLKVINTVEFSFGTVLCAIFVFIIAEAFKQGSKLKEEQELTI